MNPVLRLGLKFMWSTMTRLKAEYFAMNVVATGLVAAIVSGKTVDNKISAMPRSGRFSAHYLEVWGYCVPQQTKI